VEGAPTALEKVEFLIGGQSVVVDLRQAASLQVLTLPPANSVECTLIARQDDAEVARLQTKLAIHSGDSSKSGEPSAALSKVVIQPPKLAEDKVIKVLPEVASNIQVGGGGRYLVLHLPKLNKLAIFDVNEAAIVRYIPLAEDKIVYTTGLEKVVIGLPKKGALEVWDLATGEKELTRPVPGGGDLTSLLMGFASRGPIITNSAVLDLATLKPLPVSASSGFPIGEWPVSADGSTVGAWQPNSHPPTSVYSLAGDELTRYMGSEYKHVCPSPDGRYVYTGQGIYSNQLKDITILPPSPGYCLPATEGNYFVSLTSAQDAKTPGGLSVYLLGIEQPLLKDPRFGHGIRFDGWDREAFGPWRRVFFIPRAKLIIVFPASNDRLILHRFDADEALDKSDIDYLLVTSSPPLVAKRGAEFTYQLTVKSKKGEVKYKVGSGPDGMEISPTGLVKWKVPSDAKNGQNEVILNVRDASGQEEFHTFKLRLTDG
jgi:hypothetical protein